MKIYVAAKFGDRKEVRKIMDIIESRGHKIVGDWTNQVNIKPYEDNQELAEKYSIMAHDTLDEADIFIQFPHMHGKGMHIELGMALARNRLHGKPIIFIVGKPFDTIFHFHSLIIRKNSLAEVLDELDKLYK